VHGGTTVVHGGTTVVHGGTTVVHGGTLVVHGGTTVVHGGTTVVHGGVAAEAAVGGGWRGRLGAQLYRTIADCCILEGCSGVQAARSCSV
jgi:hypothetical protein